MFVAGIQKLKDRQAAEAAHALALLEVLLPVRRTLIERMQVFAQEALAAGLAGYGPLQIKAYGAHNLECSILLNNLPLIIISTDEVLHAIHDDAGQGYGPLTGRILVYLKGEEDGLPFVEIDVQQTARETYQCVIAKRPHVPGGQAYSDRLPISAFTGERAVEVADHVIHYLIDFFRLWPEHPAIDWMREKQGERKFAFGFMPQPD